MDRDKYRMISFIYGIPKNDTNELIDRTETDSGKQICTVIKGERLREGIN